MSEVNTMNKPQGKGLAVTGFILSLVGIVFAVIVFGIVALNMVSGGGMGLAYFWLFLCLLSVVFSAMGMMKLGKTGGKRGLAITGLIIGLVALIWSIMLYLGLSSQSDEIAKARGKVMNELDKIEQNLDKAE